ncbi:MAG TPA: amidohydrolase family protein [Chitinophagaceae bacterium]|nr:amidohydrolase family protein [Chitinophagaceae bacterium]
MSIKLISRYNLPAAPRAILLFLVVICIPWQRVESQVLSAAVQPFVSLPAGSIAITDVTVIDGLGTAARPHQTVLLQADRIVQVGNAKDIVPPAGATVIDGRGKTLIPGLVMLHEHMYYTSPLEAFFHITEMAYSFPRLYLAAGVTTLRTAGSIEPQTDLAIKRMIGEGKLTGPNMDVTAPYIERAGFDIPTLNVIKDTAEAAASVAFWSAKGCTSFKMYMHATRADLATVVREAHQRGLKVTGHLGAITYREAANLGIDNLEHGFMASTDFVVDKKEDQLAPGREALVKLPVNSPAMKDLISHLIAKKVAITSTLPVFEPYTGREIVHGGGLPALLPLIQEQLTAEWKERQNKDSVAVQLFKKELAWEKQFYDAGGLLVAGTDPTGAGRTIAGYSNYREVELLVEAGFTAAQAIQICSYNGAVYLQQAKEIGSIEKGKKADLVLIDGDLGKDIQLIRKTNTVFKNGVGFNAQKMFDSVKGQVGLY